MYAIKACEGWRYGSKPRVSGSDFGLGLWRRVVGRVDFRRSEGSWCLHRQGCEVRAVPEDLSLQQHRCEKLRTHKVQLYSFLNSALDGSKWPRLLFGRLTSQERTTQYQGRSGPFGEVHSADEKTWRSGRGPEARGPTVLHISLSLSVIL